MSLRTLIDEFFRFVKDYLLPIAFGGLMISLLTLAGRYYLSQRLDTQEQEAYESLISIYEQEPSYFQAIIYDEEDLAYINAFAIDEYFKTDEVMRSLQEQLHLDIAEVQDWQTQLELEEDADYRGSIAGIRDSSSQIITFRFQVGENAEENLAVAEFYQRLLEDQQIPFLNHQQIFVIQPATIGEPLPEEKLSMVSQSEVLNIYHGLTTRTLIIYGTFGFIVGVMLMIGCLILVRLFKDKINYAFEYSWEFNDQHLLLQTSQLTALELEEIIQTPALTQRIVLVQTHEDAELVIDETEPIIYSHNLLELNRYSIDPKEIVLIIYTNQTDKEWYRHQAMLAHLYQVPLKIIHIIQ